MGQYLSKAVDALVPDSKTEESSSASAHNSSPSTSTSMESSLPAGATTVGNEEEYTSLEAKAQELLESPCIQNLRTGPCGSQFSDAFLCYLKSTSEEKGSDCVQPFVALKRCIQTNPNAFLKDSLEDNETEIKSTMHEKPSEDSKFIFPRWSVERSSPKR